MRTQTLIAALVTAGALTVTGGAFGQTQQDYTNSGRGNAGPDHVGSRAKGSTEGPNSLGNAPSSGTAGTTSGVARSKDAAGPSHMGSRAKGSTHGPDSLSGKSQ